MYGFFQAVVSAWDSPKTTQNSPLVARIRPGMSRGSRSAARSFFNHKSAPVAAIGREDEVDEQGPAPRDVGGQNATEEETDGATRPGDAAVDAEGLAPLGRIGERGGEEGQDRGGEERPEGALDAAGGDQHREADGGTTEGRREGEPDQADEERTLAPDDVADAAARGAAGCRRRASSP